MLAPGYWRSVFRALRHGTDTSGTISGHQGKDPQARPRDGGVYRPGMGKTYALRRFMKNWLNRGGSKMERNGLLSLQAMMFLLIGAGVFLKKKNIITGEGRKVLTDLIVDIILPCNIIGAFYTAFDKEMLISGLQILIVSLALQLFCMLISGFCYKRVPKSQRVILQYGTVCSNAGFLGNPVAEGLYGSLGLLYASIYLIPQRIVMWSAGISYFTESPDKKKKSKPLN